MAVLLPQAGGAAGARAVPGGPDLVGYLLTCAFVLALVLGAAWLVRRFFSGALKTRAAQRSLRVVDVLPLGGRQRLVVVRCYDRTFLLGQGEKEVRAISELDVEDAVPVACADAAPAERDESSQARRAADAFARLLGRPGAGEPDPAAPLPRTAQAARDPGAAPARRTTATPPPTAVEEPSPRPVRWSEATAHAVEERPRRPVLDGGKGILG